MKKLILACILLAAAPVLAQDSQTELNPKAETWKVVYSLIGELMNEDIGSKMSMIAYHEVAQEICEDVHTDTSSSSSSPWCWPVTLVTPRL